MPRPATLHDLSALVELENLSFTSDRLTRRNLRYMLTKARAVVLVDDDAASGRLRGYVLVLFSNATSLARLYSITVHPDWRGRGVGKRLVQAAERAALEHNCVLLRLEIRQDNPASHALFRSLGYKPFKIVPDYYQDHMAALRYEKRLQPQLQAELARVPYYRQTLDFTCGPAALLMAMQALDASSPLERKLELRLWREATTVFMTSGHGGCGPYGLALAAYRRGFEVAIYVSDASVFMIDSVRSQEKKEVMRLVQEDMLDELGRLPIAIHYTNLTAAELRAQFDAGAIPLVLISQYRFYHERVPHWVVVTGFDDRYVYAHDPYVDEQEGEIVTDSISMPIPLRDFARIARYGKAAYQAVVLVRHPHHEPLRYG